MVDMQLTNHKLWERAVRMVLDQIHCTEEEALLALQSEKSVRKAVAKLQEEGKGAKC
jgi:N-acetylmuramic acid 6-phosphate etherase